MAVIFWQSYEEKKIRHRIYHTILKQQICDLYQEMQFAQMKGRFRSYSWIFENSPYSPIQTFA
jgi:hypothetical protein